MQSDWRPCSPSVAVADDLVDPRLSQTRAGSRF
jgi:hypothetical protein